MSFCACHRIWLVRTMGLCANDMLCHEDAFNVARCYAPRAQRSAEPATATKCEPLPNGKCTAYNASEQCSAIRRSQKLFFCQYLPICGSCSTHKLGHQASCQVRGSVIVLCHTCRDQYYSIDIGTKWERHWPTRLQKLDPQVSRKAGG